MAIKTIASIGGIFVAILIVIILFRRFDVGNLLSGAVGGTTDFFKQIQDSVGSLFPEDNSSSISGETVPFTNDDSGFTVDIPDDTIVNDDGTVEGSPPTLNIPPEEKEQIESRFVRQKNLSSRIFEKNLDKKSRLSDSQRNSAFEISKSLKSVDVLRAPDGFTRVPFLPDFRDSRAISIAKAKSLAEKRGKQFTFGGFGSATAQEQALADAIAESRKKNPFVIGSGKSFSSSKSSSSNNSNSKLNEILTQREKNDIAKLNQRNTGRKNKQRSAKIIEAKRRAEERATKRLGNSSSAKGKQGRGKLFGNF